MSKELRNKFLAQALLALSQLAFPLVTYPVVTKALGAEGLGGVNFADSIVQLVLILASLGIPLYGIREIAVNKGFPQKQAQTYLELMILQAVSVLPAIALVWIIGSISHVNGILLTTGSVALAASCLSGDWFLQGRENFLWVAVRSFCIRALTAFLVYRFIRTPSDAPLYYILLTGSVVLTMIMNASMILRGLRRPGTGIRPWHHLKKINWVYACYVVASLYTVGDSLFLGWLCPDRTVGYYSFAYKLVRLSSMIIPTLGLVFIPAIAFHHSTSDKTRMNQQVDSSQRLIFFFGLPLSVFFFVLAPEIIAVFAHGDFAPSIPVIRILSLIPLLVSFSHLTGTQLLVSIKKEKIYLAFLVAGAIINILLDLIFISRFREQAAAFSNLTTEAFVALGTLLYLRRHNLLHFQSSQLLLCLLCSLPIYPLTLLFRHLHLSPIAILLASSLSAAAGYMLFAPRFLKHRGTGAQR